MTFTAGSHIAVCFQSGDCDESSSDGGASDIESEPRIAKQEPQEYGDDTGMATTNGALPHNFPGLLNLQGNIILIYL